MRELLDFNTALLRAEEMGFVTDVCKVEDCVFTGKVPPAISAVTLARIMALNLPGQGYPSKSGGGVTWFCGSKQIGSVISPHTLADIRLSQAIVKSVVGNDYDEKWTFGGLARQLLKHVRPGKQSDGYTGDAERLLLGTPYGYSECVPGITPAVVYYDVSAYYYNMLSRIKSLNVHCGRKVLTWEDNEPSEWERWERVIRNVKEVKPLRNVLAGNMAGATPSDVGLTPVRVYWNKALGKVRVDPIPHSWGRFRAVGLLLVRTGAELLMRTCHAAGNSVVYANVDAVHLHADKPLPEVWQDYGFGVSVKAEGFADTCHRGSYRVGKKETLPYSRGERAKIREERLPLPPVQYASWLSMR